MFFKRQIDDLSQDQRDIRIAKRMLSVNEYRLFELAYRAWYGEVASESELEAYYSHYLFSGRAPCWVRQYLRNVYQPGKRADGSEPYQHKQILRQSKPMIAALNPDAMLLLMVLISLLTILR
jgi:hypothetical protein